MRCDECKKRQATVHITKIVNGEKTLLHLCEQCAKEKSIFDVSFEFEGEPFSMQKFLAGFFEPIMREFHEKSQPLSCEGCGLTFPRFSQIGRFGCSRCYEAFKGQLDPMLRRLHGKTYHVGKVPRKRGGRMRIKSEIERLKRELQEAVNAEEYERAAVLRDKIKELEQKLGRD